MLQDYISEYALMVIAGLLCILVAIKLYLLGQTGIRQGQWQIFTSSFGILSKRSIRNIFHEKLKKFYKSSNALNSWFYLLMGMVLIAWLFIKIL